MPDSRDLLICLLLGAGPLFAVHSTVSLLAGALWAAPLALLLGVCGPLYQKLFGSVRFAGRWMFALLWGGVAVGLLGVFHTTVWGNGDLALLDVLKGNEPMAGVALILGLRLIATTVCVGTGTVGGVLTPTLFAGASIGFALACLVHSTACILLAIVGLSTLLSAVTHAPFMAAFMAVELTGQYHLLPWLLLLNCLAWLVAKRLSSHSLYAIATPVPLSS